MRKWPCLWLLIIYGVCAPRKCEKSFSLTACVYSKSLFIFFLLKGRIYVDEKINRCGAWHSLPLGIHVRQVHCWAILKRPVTLGRKTVFRCLPILCTLSDANSSAYFRYIYICISRVYERIIIIFHFCLYQTCFIYNCVIICWCYHIRL